MSTAPSTPAKEQTPQPTPSRHNTPAQQGATCNSSCKACCCIKSFFNLRNIIILLVCIAAAVVGGFALHKVEKDDLLKFYIPIVSVLVITIPIVVNKFTKKSKTD